MVSGSDVSFRSIEIIDKTSRKNQLKNLNYFFMSRDTSWNFISWPLPIGSMYGIYANIWGILMVNVTIYSIHGSYGLVGCHKNPVGCLSGATLNPHRAGASEKGMYLETGSESFTLPLSTKVRKAQATSGFVQPWSLHRLLSATWELVEAKPIKPTNLQLKQSKT